MSNANETVLTDEQIDAIHDERTRLFYAGGLEPRWFARAIEQAVLATQRPIANDAVLGADEPKYRYSDDGKTVTLLNPEDALKYWESQPSAQPSECNLPDTSKINLKRWQQKPDPANAGRLDGLPRYLPSEQAALDLTNYIEGMIESSDGRWYDGEFRIDSSDLMNFCRSLLANATPQVAQPSAEMSYLQTKGINDVEALELAAAIMTVVNGPWYPGGAVQIKAKIQEIILDNVAAVETTKDERTEFEAWAIDQDMNLTRGMVRERDYSYMQTDHAWRVWRGVWASLATPPTVDQSQDAERYRLLKRGQHWSVINGVGDTLRGEALDSAIDAAIAASKSDGALK